MLKIYWLIILAFIYSFIPIHLADFIKDLPLKLQKTIQPKREVFFYRCFIIFALLGQAVVFFWFRHRKEDIPRQALLNMALVDLSLVLIEIFAVFKIWQYENPWWARALLYGGIGAWVLVRIFWGECQQGLKIISEVVMEKRKILKFCLEGTIPILLVLCLWVPDVQKVLGRVFVWDQFRNWDTTIMLPGWGCILKEVLNTDIISSWGMGAVIFISRCSGMLGGFDYAHVLTLLMGMVIAYYLLLYIFLKVWLRSILLAVATVAVAIKVQMFHTGISPLIWIYPQDTAVRHWLDIPVLWCLWEYSRSSQHKYLGLAGLGIGAALAWAFSTGLCLLAAFWGYLIFLATVPEYRSGVFEGFKQVRRTVFYGLIPLAVMGLILFLLQGRAVFQAVFWKNVFEPWLLFLHGVGTQSFYICLYDRHFFAFITSFVIPVIYAWTLIIVAGEVYLKKRKGTDLFLVPLCVYGLSLYVHYLARATISHYYAVGIPVVMVLGFWASKAEGLMSSGMRLKVFLMIAAGAWGALLTNILFVYYPNTFDMARMDWKPEIDLYQTQFKFDQDASMIDRLVPEGQKVAVISSFETGILMQARRKPFFYYAPLVSSARMDTNVFAGTSVVTRNRMVETVGQITQQSPEYIFIEKKLLGQWPKEYVQYYPGILGTLGWVAEHYTPQEQGMFLIAMHKK